MKRIYISGPITDQPNLNREAFFAAEAALRTQGFEPVNPHRNGQAPDATWAQHMRADIKLLMDCDALVWLEGWEKSRGARLEMKLAYGLGMPVMHMDELFDQQRARPPKRSCLRLVSGGDQRHQSPLEQIEQLSIDLQTGRI
jgi:nucleoside 2-deoxyribosyltransferase